MKILWLYIIFLAALCVQPLAAQELSLEQKLYTQAAQGIFEVVVKKMVQSPEVQAQKRKEGRPEEILHSKTELKEPFPWDLLPYDVRTDEYQPIGTAFAMELDGQLRFVSAAHVLQLDTNSLWSDWYIRDTSKKVYAIDQITMYDKARDFGVFTVKGNPQVTPLAYQREYTFNTAVKTLGNALGEGIVLRTGLLTSATPESESGRWDFLRFSAPASPGNSGGPLLNEKGEVIGIVLRKSENENLNYALPISELLDAPRNLAILQCRGLYNLPAITQEKYGPEKIEIKEDLPLPYRKFKEQVIPEIVKKNRMMAQSLIDSLDDGGFPFSTKAQKLNFRQSGWYSFLHIAGEDENHDWDYYRPSKIHSSELDDGAKLYFGALSNMQLIQFRKDPKTPLSEYLSDSKVLMDRLLEGFPIRLDAGSKMVRVSSLGKASSDTQHVDLYGRKWRRLTYPVIETDALFLLYLLPTPFGFTSMAIFNRSGAVEEEYDIDMQVFLNYVGLPYWGQFSEWQDFLQNFQEWLPKDTQVQLSYDTDKQTASVQINDMSFRYDQNLQEISDESDLTLYHSYRIQGPDAATWEPSGFYIGESDASDSYISMSTYFQPNETWGKDYTRDWEDQLSGKENNGKITVKDEESSADLALGPDLRPLVALDGSSAPEKSSSDEQPDKLYIITLNHDGEIEKTAMQEKLQHFIDGLAVTQ